MEFTDITIGIMIGLLIGAVMMGLLDRRHQKVAKKLIESRRKIERQRTQAVNDLFALRAELDDPNRRPVTTVVERVQVQGPDPETAAELANLRSLIARADGALTAARRKRDENDAEIRRLRGLLEEKNHADVIDLHKQGRVAL